MSLNLFQSLRSLSLSHSWWPFLFSFSLPSLCLLCLLCLVFHLFPSSLKLCLVVTSSSFLYPLFFVCSSSFTPSYFLHYESSLFAPLPNYFPFPYLLWVTSSLPTFVSQLPGEVASLQARVRCCPMCAAEGPDPRAGGGVQGARGGHGVRTQGSRDGHRRGMVRGHKVWPAGIITICLKTPTPMSKCNNQNPLSHCYACHCFNSVPAPVQEPPLELFHHHTWDQCIWQSHEPRYPHTENVPADKSIQRTTLTWRRFCIICSILVSGTREAAFVHALSSAAVAVAVTRACTRGELERCGCDRKVRGVSPEGELGFLCMKM